MRIAPELSQTLKQIRLDLGMTQQYVAAQMGVSQPTVAGFETEGADLKISTLKRLMRVYGADLTISAVLPNGDTHEIVRELATELPPVILHGTDFQTTFSYNDEGVVEDIELECELRHGNEFMGYLTIDKDRLPKSYSDEDILEVAKGATTFDCNDRYGDREFKLELTPSQLTLIVSIISDIQLHAASLK